MRVSAFWICAATLLLAPSTCVANDRGPSDDSHETGRRLRVRIVVEVDLLGSSSPRIAAEIGRNPSPPLP